MRTSPVVIGVVVLLAVGGCGLSPGEGESSGGGGSVYTLAKVDGWRQGFEPPKGQFGVLEVAYDAATAQALWDDNVPADLPVREGDPTQQGLYGDVDAVNFTEQAVAVWSSGQSGSCPGWVSDVDTRAGGEVLITRAEDLQGGNACTDDYRFYRVVVVVDRRDLPDPTEVDAAHGAVASQGDGGPLEALVVGYPLA